MQHPSKYDIASNYLAMILGGVAGFLLPVLVGVFYGAAGLGDFNVVFSLYIILSQVAALGVHLSVLKYLAEAQQDTAQQRLVLQSGLWAVIPVAFTTTCLLCLLSPVAAWVYGNPAIGVGLFWASLGLFFFACNKVLLASLNALGKLQHYAVYTSLRFIFLLAALVGFRLLECLPAYLPVIFPLGEGVLCCLMLHPLRTHIVAGVPFALVRQRVWGHLTFGGKAFGGNILMDINSRIDILCLGFFVDSRTVGIYSMAAVVAEAAYQIPIVARTVYSPQIVLALYNRQYEALQHLVAKLRKYLWCGMGAACLLGLFLYPVCIPFITGIPEYSEGTLYLGILLTGVTIASGYAPFNLILAAGGFPGRQSTMILFLVSVNLISTCMAVPLLGAVGAACTTALTYVLSVFALRLQVRRYLGFPM